MSTMLKSVNPEAAEEMDPDRDRRVPYVGQCVLYHARPGEGRQGKLVTPSWVIGVEDEDHVELLVVYSSDDFLVKFKINRKSDQNPFNAWTFNSYDEENYLKADVAIGVALDVSLLAKDIAELRQELSEVRQRLFVVEGKTAVKLPHKAPKHEAE